MKIKIFETELEFDVADVEFIEKYEKGLEDMKAKDEELGKLESVASQMKAYCQAIFDYFDYLFGEGTSDKIFGGKYNVTLCDSAFDILINNVYVAVSEQQKKNKERKKKYNKYVIDIKKA